MEQKNSDDYQADAGAPALSEKFNQPGEKRPEDFCCLSADAIYEIRKLLNAQDVPSAAFIDDHVANAIAQRNILAMCLTNIRNQIDAALAEAKVNFSNEAERDGVRLKSDTSSHPSTEVEKISTDTEVRG